ncbi:MAG: hypothetical protein WCI03_09860 [bacterium]
MNLFLIAASDMDVIIGIIAVIGWILAQIFGRKKGDPSRQEGSPSESSPPLDPQDELRKFFEGLEEKVKPPAPPQRPVAPPPLHQKTHREKSVRRSHEPQMETLSSQIRGENQMLESVTAFQATVVQPALTQGWNKPTRCTSAMPELHNPTTLRKFIIANEILGKPVALRQGQTS